MLNSVFISLRHSHRDHLLYFTHLQLILQEACQNEKDVIYVICMALKKL